VGWLFCCCHHYLVVCIDANRTWFLWSLYARKQASSKPSFLLMHFKFKMWVWIVSFEHSFYDYQVLLEDSFFFQNLKMELVLLIYCQLNSCVFLLMKEVIFFATFLKELYFVKTLKKNLICWITITWDFMCFLFLKAVRWLLYYITCGEGGSNICCVLFIKATSNSCIFYFVVLGSSKQV
jgi:hypothetical protein